MRVAVLMLIAGCGRIGFAPTVDGAPDVPAGPCDLAAPLGPPVLVPGVSDPTIAEATMRLTADELRGYLWITTPNIDLAFAMRPDLTSPFTTTPISELNTTDNEFEPTPSDDELVLVFQSGRSGGTGSGDLYIAQRTNVTQPFTLLGEITSINTTADEKQPFLTANALYFVSDRGGDLDLYRAPRTGPTTFGVPVRIDEASFTGAIETDPVMSFDEKRLYFGSDRADIGNNVDIYVATRVSTTDPFDPPTRLSVISTTALEGASWESRDGCRLYLASAILGTPDVYVTSRP